MNDLNALKILITDKGKIKTRYKSIVEKNKELETYLDNRFNDSESLVETIYRIQHQIYKRPVCPICNQPIKFISGIGFRETCSVSCAKKLIKKNDTVITDEIIKNDYLKNGKLNSKNKLQLKYLKEHNYYDYLLNRYADCDNSSEAIYRICNNIDNKSKCKMCNNYGQFNGIEVGYDDYCSYKCRELNKIPEITDDYIKQLGAKSKITNPTWCGYKKVETYLKNKFKEQYRDYNEAIYMVLNDIKEIPKCSICGKLLPFNFNDYNDKKYRKYCSQECYNEDKRNLLINKIYNKLHIKAEYDKNENVYIIYNECKQHPKYTLTYRQLHRRIFNIAHKTDIICPICNPERNPETSIERIIRNILEELDIKFEEHNRKIISPKELDFYLPDYNSAIECNGLYWHSDFKKEKAYHYNKFKDCENKGIVLLTFWENDIINNTDKIKHLIKTKFNKNENIINGEDCKIKEISSNEAKQFLNDYSLFNDINSSIRLGLYFNDQLVYVITFKRLNKKQYRNKKCYEINRLCSKFDYTIINSEKIILNYFITQYKPDLIYLYINNDNNVLDLNMLDDIGFKFDKDIKYSYFYFDLFEDCRLTKEQKAKIKDNYRVLNCQTSGKKLFKWEIYI